MKRGFILKFLPFLVILLLVVLLGAKYIYNKFTEPNRYTPRVSIELTSPVQNTLETTPKEPGIRALLPGAKWVPQTFNNCGPATTSMVLQYFGHNVGQEETKARLRSNVDDKNVFTYEIADYLRQDFGIESKLMYGGDIQMIKRLVSNGFYVVIEDWLHPNEDIGHTTIIRGYDDEQQVLIADDSFIGINITYPYEEFTQTQWKPFNYEYLAVFTKENESLFKAIVGELWDEQVMYERALATASDEIDKNPSDVYAHFNKGSSLFALGKYTQARDAYEKSRSLGWPKRMLWYQIQPIETYNKLGQFQQALEAADLALWENDSFAEAHLEKAIAFKGLNEPDRAHEEAQKALVLDPDFQKAQDFLSAQ